MVWVGTDLKDHLVPPALGRDTYDWFFSKIVRSVNRMTLGAGGRGVTYSLISFPIQHAKTHTSATMRLSQQLLPEQKAGSPFNAFKTKHIIFYALPWADGNTTSEKQQQLKTLNSKLKILKTVNLDSRTITDQINYKRHDFSGLRPSPLDHTFSSSKKFILLFTTKQVRWVVRANPRESTFLGKKKS